MIRFKKAAGQRFFGRKAVAIVKSTGLKGGDRGHGGYSKVQLNFPNEFCLETNIVRDDLGIIVELSAFGDWEMRTLAEMFEATASALRLSIENERRNK